MALGYVETSSNQKAFLYTRRYTQLLDWDICYSMLGHSKHLLQPFLKVTNKFVGSKENERSTPPPLRTRLVVTLREILRELILSFCTTNTFVGFLLPLKNCLKTENLYFLVFRIITSLGGQNGWSRRYCTTTRWV